MGRLRGADIQQQVDAMSNWLAARPEIEWVWIAPHDNGAFCGRAAKISRKEAPVSKPTKKKGGY